jgi:hypothetical protein
MTYISYSSGGCTASITKNRNRVKVYQDKSNKSQIFLQDGEEFEIELFNPKQNQILAKIWINNKLISTSGIVLKPGQRVYLERYIDTPEKFTFSTYEVEDSKEAKEAIAKNGFIKVEFYDEYVISNFGNPIWTNGSGTLTTSNPTWTTYTTPTYGGSTLNNVFYASNTIGGKPSLTSSIGSLNEVKIDTQNISSKSVETGRIEGGEQSEQKFETTYGNFNSWSSSSVEVQILPVSQKPVEIGEIRKYCTECGTRVKKSSWKFCPSCGAKF